MNSRVADRITVTPFKPALPVPPARPATGSDEWVVEASYNLADCAPPMPLAVQNLLAIHGMVLINARGTTPMLVRRDGPIFPALNVDYTWTLEQWIDHVTHFDELSSL